jgi:hypothetical protein
MIIEEKKKAIVQNTIQLVLGITSKAMEFYRVSLVSWRFSLLVLVPRFAKSVPTQDRKPGTETRNSRQLMYEHISSNFALITYS